MSTDAPAPKPDERWDTPPMLAREWRVKPEKILAFIAAGELRAINFASAGCKRPRWRISPIDKEIFLNRRAGGPTPKAPRKRRRRDDDVIQFFK